METIKYMLYCLSLFISAAFGNNPDGLTWVTGLIGFGTLVLIILLTALLLYCFLWVAHFFLKERPVNAKVKKMPIKKKFVGISFIILGLFWIILISFEQTRIYGFILFGTPFVVSGILVLTFRMLFDLSDKVIVSGTLVQLEHIVDSEGYSSYRPHYQYAYQNNNYILISQFSAFWYKKTKSLGEVTSIALNVKNPQNARINKPIYTFLEYLAGIVLIIAGLFFVIYGIS